MCYTAPSPARAVPVQNLMRATMPLKHVDEFFARLSAADPEPKGELDYVNDFTLLVAVVLSAQATDVGVNRATKDLFRIADNPEKMLALGEAKVRDYIKTCLLYTSPSPRDRTRSRMPSSA